MRKLQEGLVASGTVRRAADIEGQSRGERRMAKPCLNKHFVDSYAADTGKVFRIGVKLDSKNRQIEEWKVE